MSLNTEEILRETISHIHDLNSSELGDDAMIVPPPRMELIVRGLIEVMAEAVEDRINERIEELRDEIRIECRSA